MTHKILFILGICIFLFTFSACNYALWFKEAEIVTEEIFNVEKAIEQTYDVHRVEPYIRSEDQLEKVLHSDANRWSIQPSESPKN